MPRPSIARASSADYAEQVALCVLRHEAERGIIITSRAVGASVAANRVPGIRAALCHDAHSAPLGAKLEGMNVLVLALHSLAGRACTGSRGRLSECHPCARGGESAACRPGACSACLPTYAKTLLDELSVAELAQTVGMSQYYFSKLFKMSTGTTPHQYVMRQRVERAQELLRERPDRAGQGRHPGRLRDPEPFHQRISPVVGITPKRYREMHQPAALLEMQRQEAATAA